MTQDSGPGPGGGTVAYQGWKIETLEAGGRWRFTAYRIEAQPGDLERIQALSAYRSREEALEAARSMIDRKPWKADGPGERPGPP